MPNRLHEESEGEAPMRGERAKAKGMDPTSKWRTMKLSPLTLHTRESLFGLWTSP